VKGSAVHKNITLNYPFTELSPINHYFHNGCLSWSNLGKY